MYQGERAAVRNTFASACREEEGGRKGSEREREHLLLEELALLCSRFHALTDTSTRTPGKDVQSYVHVHTHTFTYVERTSHTGLPSPAALLLPKLQQPTCLYD